MNRKRQDVEKERRWRRTIQEAARSGISIREFCQQGKLKVSQFYWWQHRLKETQQRRIPKSGANDGPASFALVSEDPGATPAGIELVLGDGRRLRISKGVDEETLRAVLAAVGTSAC